MKPVTARACSGVGVLIWLIVGSSAAFAQARVALPLEGYYRPGRTFPAVTEAAVSLHGAGIIPARLQGAGVLPVMCIDESARELHAGESSFALRPVSANQTLVVFVDVPATDLSALYAGLELIPIRTSSVLFNRQTLGAWTSAGVAVFADLPANLLSILAAGIDVIVVSDSAPETEIPMESNGRLHLIRSGVVGLVGASGNGAAGELFSWWRGSSNAQMRSTATWIAVILPLVFVACMLAGRSLLVGCAAGACSVAAVIAIQSWSWRIDPLSYASGAVRIHGPRHTQEDVYAVVRAARQGELRLPIEFQPLIDSAEHSGRIGLGIEVDAQSRAWWTARLSRGEMLVLMRRTIRAQEMIASTRPMGKSPLRTLARVIYTDAGLRTVGEADLPPVEGWESWGVVILERAAR